MEKDPNSNFDKLALIDDLKRAGFRDDIAKDVAEAVDSKKIKGWTYDMGRQEAIRVAREIIDSSHQALDRFREEAMPPIARRSGPAERPHQHYAERIADSGKSPA